MSRWDTTPQERFDRQYLKQDGIGCKWPADLEDYPITPGELEFDEETALWVAYGRPKTDAELIERMHQLMDWNLAPNQADIYGQRYPAIYSTWKE